jgi:hypothetical protein
MKHLPIQRSLNRQGEILLTLMKLRQGLQFRLLGDLFYISRQMAAKIFQDCLNVLAAELKCLIIFPTRDQLNIPLMFQAKYPNIRCIIDCTEIYICKPASKLAQALTWSDYNKTNTIKYLIAITPRGTICFLSPGMGGRASDKCVVKDSGFLDEIQPGDVVMADKGFLIEEDLISAGAKLAVPPGKRGQSQMTRLELFKTKTIANLRIHVERAIKRIKEFNILNSPGGLSLLLAPHLDTIMTVCCSLCNLLPPLVQDADED